MSILTASGVTIEYRSLSVLKDVSFSVEYGDYFCVVGSNGSGKSSLIKCILGLIPYTGEIKTDVKKSEIAYLPQISSIPEGMPATVKEVVLTGRQKSGKRLPFYTKADKLAFEEISEKLKIKDFQDKKITELSGGQQQRALLARALISNPKLLILDEPTSGLDEHSTSSLYSLLDELNEEQKMTIIMVTHDLDDVKFCANKVLVLDSDSTFCGNVNEWLKRRRGGHHHEH